MMINYMKTIFSGEKLITDYMRYELVRVGVGIVHVILLILFLNVGCVPLAVFNIFSVLFYAVLMEYFIKREKYLLAFTSTYLEIVLHSFFACIMVGWPLGFSLYNIGLIYVAYYFAYTSPKIHKKILISSILGIINLILTLGMRLYSYAFGPEFTDYTSAFAFWMSVMNIVIAAIMIMFFATLHTMEIRRKEYELRTMNARLDKLAHFDALTKLRNRHSMEEELHSLLEKTTDEYCFIMGDIDNFKQFNDTYGHACGDYVLKAIADIILKNTGENQIACRWGGEEILILLKANLEYAYNWAEKIRYEIEHMKGAFEDIQIHTTMTFGIAPYLADTSFEACISQADKNLYAGKKKGKNCVV